jgi:hypothetical protein
VELYKEKRSSGLDWMSDYAERFCVHSNIPLYTAEADRPCQLNIGESYCCASLSVNLSSGTADGELDGGLTRKESYLSSVKVSDNIGGSKTS